VKAVEYWLKSGRADAELKAVSEFITSPAPAKTSTTPATR
jgi:hypothetical protein